MLTRFHLLTLAGLLACATPADGATYVLDAMTDVLPPNGCLPSNRLVIFQGPFCDAPPCPPSPYIQPSCPGVPYSFAEQSGLPGVASGARRTMYLDGGYERDSGVSAYVDPGQAVTVFDIGAVPRGRLGFLYYPADEGSWSLDMAALGLQSVRLTLAGEISALAPVLGTFELYNYDEAGSMAWCEFAATAPGTVSLPFSAFHFDPGFDFSNVAQVHLELFDCEPCGGPLPPRRYTVGPIVFDSDVTTPSVRSSWGRLKTSRP